jgi:hypothetical protein
MLSESVVEYPDENFNKDVLEPIITVIEATNPSLIRPLLNKKLD